MESLKRFIGCIRGNEACSVSEVKAKDYKSEYLGFCEGKALLILLE